MQNAFITPRRKVVTPPNTPIQPERGGGDDEDPRGQVMVYAEDAGELEKTLRIPTMMADSIWKGIFHVSGFSKIDELEGHLHRKVLQNPKLLVSLTYVITRENVNRCLDSFLGFFTKVPGFESSSDLQERIRNIKQKIDPKMLADLYPEHSTPEEAIQSIILRIETKARVAEALLCVHQEDTTLVLDTAMDPLLDRLPDVGDIIRRKFSGEIWSGPMHETIVAQMTNFTLFGDE